MSNFKKPYAWYRSIAGCDECKVFDNYRLLRKEMKDMMSDSKDNVITVTRTRRNEWGEWFEHWHMVNGKPTIVKQGWQ